MHKNCQELQISFEEYIYDILKNRKNFMVYEGIRDGLDEDIKYKYFYSNPYDAFEYVTFDIFKYPKIILLNNKKIEAYGLFSTVKDRIYMKDLNETNIFGTVLIKNIQIRDVDKNQFLLYLNKKAFDYIEETIHYFESNICKKGIV